MEMSVIRCESADKEWLRFVSACRSEQKSGDEAIRRLLPFKLKDQYAFKSEKALELLTFKRGIFV